MTPEQEKDALKQKMALEFIGMVREGCLQALMAYDEAKRNQMQQEISLQNKVALIDQAWERKKK